MIFNLMVSITMSSTHLIITPIDYHTHDFHFMMSTRTISTPMILAPEISTNIISKPIIATSTIRTPTIATAQNCQPGDKFWEFWYPQFFHPLKIGSFGAPSTSTP